MLERVFANRTLIGITDLHSHEQMGILDGPGVVYVGYCQRIRAIVEKHTDQERLMPKRSLELMTLNGLHAGRTNFVLGTSRTP